MVVFGHDGFIHHMEIISSENFRFNKWFLISESWSHFRVVVGHDGFIHNVEIWRENFRFYRWSWSKRAGLTSDQGGLLSQASLWMWTASFLSYELTRVVMAAVRCSGDAKNQEHWKLYTKPCFLLCGTVAAQHAASVWNFVAVPWSGSCGCHRQCLCFLCMHLVFIITANTATLPVCCYRTTDTELYLCDSALR